MRFSEKLLKFTRITSGLLLIFLLSVPALVGGFALISVPDGSTLQMKTELLRHSPFSDFFIPGVVLFSVNGILAMIAGVLCISGKWIYPRLTVFMGFFVVMWISIQLFFIHEFIIFQPLYLALGAVLIVLGLLMDRMKNKVSAAGKREIQSAPRPVS
ncbi:MAG TPA: hypothetical protein VFU15_04950 [Bacteroidia bacterium]|nr:hypothetical protein [Bacteroidia bacterium]